MEPINHSTKKCLVILVVPDNFHPLKFRAVLNKHFKRERNGGSNLFLPKHFLHVVDGHGGVQPARLDIGRLGQRPQPLRELHEAGDVRALGPEEHGIVLLQQHGGEGHRGRQQRGRFWGQSEPAADQIRAVLWAHDVVEFHGCLSVQGPMGAPVDDLAALLDEGARGVGLGHEVGEQVYGPRQGVLVSWDVARSLVSEKERI